MNSSLGGIVLKRKIKTARAAARAKGRLDVIRMRYEDAAVSVLSGFYGARVVLNALKVEMVEKDEVISHGEQYVSACQFKVSDLHDVIFLLSERGVSVASQWVLERALPEADTTIDNDDDDDGDSIAAVSDVNEITPIERRLSERFVLAVTRAALMGSDHRDADWGDLAPPSIRRHEAAATPEKFEFDSPTGFIIARIAAATIDGVDLGEFMIAAPAEAFVRVDFDVEPEFDPEAWGLGMAKIAMGLKLDTRAVIGRRLVPVQTLGELSPGDVVPLGMMRVDDARLETIAESAPWVIAPGVVGGHEGSRAFLTKGPE